jgi:hypothetical protein
MDKMIENVRQEVEAALLNSECGPKDAVVAALRVVRWFAATEAGIEDLCAVLQTIED